MTRFRKLYVLIRHCVVRAGRVCRNHKIVVDKTLAFNNPEID